MTNDRLLETYKELSAGFHKVGLAVHGVTVRQEDHERRLTTCENDLTKGENSVWARLARYDERIREIEKDASSNTSQGSSNSTSILDLRNELARLREQLEAFKASTEESNKLVLARESSNAQVQVARFHSRATVIAAWIGAGAGLLGTIAALILALT